jgi:hypothetical protein
MSLLAVALLLSLAQVPPPCEGERMVLVPFQPVALSSAEARQVEETVRRAVRATPGVCLETRADTVTKVRAQGGRLPTCGDAACRGAQVAALGADWLVRGVALGVGGGHSVALTLVDREGRESNTVVRLSGEGLPPGSDAARVREALTPLWATRPSSRKTKGAETPGVERRRGTAWPTVLLAAGGAAIAAGVGFGLAARRSEASLSEGTAGCSGEGEDFRSCFAGRLEEGRRQARTANVLLGAGAVLGAGGAVFLVWELP